MSYVLWHEGTLPLLAVEYISKTYGNEYESKKQTYAAIDVRYYIIYNPERMRGEQQPLEIYRLENGEYLLQAEEPFWMPEVDWASAEVKAPTGSGPASVCTGLTSRAISFPRPQKWLSRSSNEQTKNSSFEKIWLLDSATEALTLIASRQRCKIC